MFPGISSDRFVSLDLFSRSLLSISSVIVDLIPSMINDQSTMSNFISFRIANAVGLKTKRYQLEIHAIGDYAAQVTVEALESAGAVGIEHRPVLTHCQVLNQKVVEDMERLKVIANVQPLFVNTDSFWVDKRLPPSLQRFAYIWKTLYDRNIIVSGGSDAPIEDPNPFLGLHSGPFLSRSSLLFSSFQSFNSIKLKEVNQRLTFSG